MKALSRHLYSLFFVILVTACTGSGVTGPSGVGPVGAGPAGGTDLGSGGDGVTGDPSLAQASGDGTLGSQSSSVDLVPGFYREYSLFFSGEIPGQPGAEYKYFLPSNPGKLPDAQVLKIFKTPVYKEVPCLACEGRWVRAVNCGPYSDDDIVQLISNEDENNPAASNPLLWFLLHMPRETGNSSVTTCAGATYRDFPVKNSGVVDFDELELHVNDIVVFYLLAENPPAEVGPLSVDATMQIPKEAIAATAKQGILRYVRPRAPLQISPEMLQLITFK